MWQQSGSRVRWEGSRLSIIMFSTDLTASVIGSPVCYQRLLLEDIMFNGGFCRFSRFRLQRKGVGLPAVRSLKPIKNKDLAKRNVFTVELRGWFSPRTVFPWLQAGSGCRFVGAGLRWPANGYGLARVKNRRRRARFCFCSAGAIHEYRAKRTPILTPDRRQRWQLWLQAHLFVHLIPLFKN